MRGAGTGCDPGRPIGIGGQMEHETGPGGAASPTWDDGSGAGMAPAPAAAGQVGGGSGVPPAAADLAGGESGVPPAAAAGTGEPRVDAALALLDQLPKLPISDHPDVFEQVHAQLSDVLGELELGQADGERQVDG
jgi:hypothetical protein